MRNLFLIMAIGLITISCSLENEKTQKVSDDMGIINDNIEIVEFPSLDSLIITARVYEIDTVSPVILLCHQARFNKFEYAGIAEELNELGFNCIAIDQRSGGPIGDQVNETTIRAIEAGKRIDYIDAEPDIIAAIGYAVERYNKPIILWGSSYSSTLALYIAIENHSVEAVVSFSPGNYMSEYKGSLIDKLEGFDKPMLVTSSLYESEGVTELLQKMEMNSNQIQFIPTGNGHHGSRALWNTQVGGEEYWIAIKSFLRNIKN